MDFFGTHELLPYFPPFINLIMYSIWLWFSSCSIHLNVVEVNAEEKLPLLSIGHFFIFITASTVCGYFLL